MRVKDLQYDVHQLAREKGFWDKPRSPAECLALIHSEVSEALEEFREGVRMGVYYPGYPSNMQPHGYGIELADALIRILDLAQHLELDMEDMIRIKMEYNKTRPYRHGKRF